MCPNRVETVASVLGGAPARLKKDLRASLGAVAAFLGLVALLLVLPLVIFMSAPFLLALELSAIVAGCASSILVGRHAFRVTDRNLWLAKTGCIASVVALVGCVVVVAVTGARALQ
jgi:hypothetical protein